MALARRRLLPLAILLIAVPVAARAPAPDPMRMRADVETLVSFGTRQSLSLDHRPQARHRRRAALGRRCVRRHRQELRQLSCGRDHRRSVQGRPRTQWRAHRGCAGDPGGKRWLANVVIVAGHIDSFLVSDMLDTTSDAPGANDDGSGSALVLEAARLLSREPHRATIVYALLSGEEQGLWGRRAAGAHGQGTRLAHQRDAQQRYRRQHGRDGRADRGRPGPRLFRGHPRERGQRRDGGPSPVRRRG